MGFSLYMFLPHLHFTFFKWVFEVKNLGEVKVGLLLYFVSELLNMKLDHVMVGRWAFLIE